MLIIVYKVLSIFLMIAVGFAACRAKLLPFASNEYLIKLLMNILSPCMILTAITSKTISRDIMTATVQMMVCTAIFFIAGAFITKGLFHLFRIRGSESGVLAFQMISKNTGFMGFPVTKGAFGPDYLYFMVLHNIIGNIYTFSGGFVQMSSGEEKSKRNIKSTVRQMINVCTVFAVAGIIMLFAGIKLPPFVMDVLSPIGDATIPVSMIVIGIQMADSNLSRIIKDKQTIVLGLLSMTLVPAAVFLAVNWLPLYTQVKMMLVYGAALPTLVFSVVIAGLVGRDATKAAEFVSFTTVISMATLPLWTMFLSYWYGVAI